MNKIIAYILLTCFTFSYAPVFAQEVAAINTQTKVEAPKWEEYVPFKYQNPRNFPKGKSIAELSTGILLTELLLTAPIGIPMIVHSTTKLKNKGYYDRKIKFEQGLEEAEKITDPVEKQKFYEDLLKKCKLTEEKREKQLKKIEKRNAKLEKKNNSETQEEAIETVDKQ